MKKMQNFEFPVGGWKLNREKNVTDRFGNSQQQTQVNKNNQDYGNRMGFFFFIYYSNETLFKSIQIRSLSYPWRPHHLEPVYLSYSITEVIMEIFYLIY